MRCEDGTRCVAASDNDGITRRVAGVERTYDLAMMAVAAKTTLAATVEADGDVRFDACADGGVGFERRSTPWIPRIFT
jgi:hypothetical protein